MYEFDITRRLNTFFKENKNEILHRKGKILNSWPDIMTIIDNKVSCIEVKGDGFVKYNLVGEIINYFLDFSHVYVATDQKNLDSIVSIFSKNKELSSINEKIGFIMMDNETKEIKILKLATNLSYYYPKDKPTKIRKKRNYRKLRLHIPTAFSYDILTFTILSKKQNETFMISDILLKIRNRNTNYTLEGIRMRLEKYIKLGYLIKISNGNPKIYQRTDKIPPIENYQNFT